MSTKASRAASIPSFSQEMAFPSFPRRRRHRSRPCNPRLENLLRPSWMGRCARWSVDHIVFVLCRHRRGRRMHLSSIEVDDGGDQMQTRVLLLASPPLTPTTRSKGIIVTKSRTPPSVGGRPGMSGMFVTIGFWGRTCSPPVTPSVAAAISIAR